MAGGGLNVWGVEVRLRVGLGDRRLRAHSIAEYKEGYAPVRAEPISCSTIPPAYFHFPISCTFGGVCHHLLFTTYSQ